MEVIAFFIGLYVLIFILKDKDKPQNTFKAPDNIKSICNPENKSSQIISSSIKNTYKLDEVQQELFDNIENNKDNYFIQGQAGTGKSTFIQYLKNNSKKRIRVASPTAIAALNIGGVTLHSLFKLPLSDFIILDKLKLSIKTSQVLAKTDLLIIDEVSMVRPDMLDAIDYLSKKARGNHKPFGGLQVLLIGDLCQLPPVIKKEVYPIFEGKYGSKDAYFFDALSYKNANFINVELNKVYRQSDAELLKYLTNIRNYTDVDETVSFFNKAQIMDEEILKLAITITPYKNVAESINQERLAELPTPSKIYNAEATGTFEESKETPSPRILVLKVGALIIFNKNNAPLWINGSSGIIQELSDNLIKVKLIESNKVVLVGQEEWKSFTYEYDQVSEKVTEKETGSFKQFPLQLGYALTIHKAQGKTLDKVIIDIDRGAFAHGQMYVALSRTRRLDDMHIINPIDITDIIIDKRITFFLCNILKKMSQDSFCGGDNEV